MSTSVRYEGRRMRRDRRYQVRVWRRGLKEYSGPFFYFRTRLFIPITTTFYRLIGWTVEIWDMRPTRKE